MIDGHDLSKLFDEQYPTIKFSEDPKDHLPPKGSIIYTVFDRGGSFQSQEPKKPRWFVKFYKFYQL